MKHPVPHELYQQWARHEPERCRHDPDGWAVYMHDGWNDIVARNSTLTALLEALPTHDWGFAFSEPPVDGALVQMHVYDLGTGAALGRGTHPFDPSDALLAAYTAALASQQPRPITHPDQPEGASFTRAYRATRLTLYALTALDMLAVPHLAHPSHGLLTVPHVLLGLLLLHAAGVTLLWRSRLMRAPYPLLMLLPLLGAASAASLQHLAGAWAPPVAGAALACVFAIPLLRRRRRARPA